MSPRLLLAALLALLFTGCAHARPAPAAPAPTATATLYPTFPPAPARTLPATAQPALVPTLPPEQVQPPLFETTFGRCAGAECLFAAQTSREYPIGLATLQGFLVNRDTLDLDQQRITCAAFAVLNGSQNFVSAARSLAAEGGGFSALDELGRPVIFLDWTALDTEVRQELRGSRGNHPVELVALVLPPERIPVSPCASPLVVLRLNAPRPSGVAGGGLPAGLQVHEYRLDHPPATNGFAYSEVQAALAGQLPSSAHERDTLVQRMLANNRLLRPFGLHLEEAYDEGSDGRYFRLFRDSWVVRDRIQSFGPVSLRADGEDFAMLIDSDLARGGSISPWEGLPGQGPVFIGQDLLWVGATDDPQTPASIDLVHVLREGEVIYTHPVAEPNPVRPDLVGFWSYGQHWVLETINSVVIDGQSINRQDGYEASFSFHQLGGRPFFFYRREGRIGVSYNGQEVDLGYDEVPHEACCSLAALNPRAAEDRLWFFARRGDQWLYVEIEG